MSKEPIIFYTTHHGNGGRRKQLRLLRAFTSS